MVRCVGATPHPELKVSRAAHTNNQGGMLSLSPGWRRRAAAPGVVQQERLGACLGARSG